jgi:hypothetical protein
MNESYGFKDLGKAAIIVGAGLVSLLPLRTYAESNRNNNYMKKEELKKIDVKEMRQNNCCEIREKSDPDYYQYTYRF